LFKSHHISPDVKIVARTLFKSRSVLPEPGAQAADMLLGEAVAFPDFGLGILRAFTIEVNPKRRIRVYSIREFMVFDLIIIRN
jgi:hypothetical protein